MDRYLKDKKLLKRRKRMCELDSVALDDVPRWRTAWQGLALFYLEE